MKKCIFSICLFLSLSSLFSQDKIFLYTGEHIDAKVLEVTVSEIKYKKFNYLEGPTIIISKSEIVMIIYENGDKDVFAKENNKQTVSNDSILTSPIKTPAEMFLLGKKDASVKYRSYKPFLGTLIPTTIFAPAGLVTALVICVSKPSIKTIEETNPDPKLIVNQDYYNKYKQKIKQKKWGRAIGGFGVGIAINVVVYALIINN